MEEIKIKKILEKLPKSPGVYFMKNKNGDILYIGKAKSLKNRVSNYFGKRSKYETRTNMMVKQIESIEIIETPSEIEALILESRMIRGFQPKYNKMQKDNKSYPYIIIKKETFPRVLIKRKHEFDIEDVKSFFGPFLNGKELGACFKYLQQIFLFRICDLDIKKDASKFYRPCILYSIKYCSGPCANKISHERYLNNINKLENFLEGDRTGVINDLKLNMIECSKKLLFEEAAQIRDQIKSIESLNKKGLSSDFVPATLQINPKKGLKTLKDVLKLQKLPRLIEGIDIAHHGGKESVGSLVCFKDGIPHYKGYRHYKIKIEQSCDDYLMLREVVRRRFTGQDFNRLFPDILLVDGGKGQLSEVLKELEEIKIKLPCVISIAKKQEEIFYNPKELPLDLPIHSPAHRIICYIRDEAHRFAQSYHHLLKKKKL